MDYGKLLSRAWDIIWEHKFLILLGLLVALGGGSRANFNTGGGGGGGQYPNGDMPPGTPMPEMPDIPGMEDFDMPNVSIAVIVLVVGLAVIVGLILWFIATVARGGLIGGVNDIVTAGVSSFGQAFNAGLGRIWTLLGISILPAIPALILTIGSLVTGGVVYFLLSQTGGTSAGATGLAGLAGVFGILICLASPILILLNLLRAFANRACMLEGLGVFASYSRGLEVLLANLGEAVVLFIIQVALGLVLGLAMGVSALCCLLWPLLIVVQGAIEAYFSTLWTLAWRKWTLPAEGMAR